MMIPNAILRTRACSAMNSLGVKGRNSSTTGTKTYTIAPTQAMSTKLSYNGMELLGVDCNGEGLPLVDH